MHARKIPVCALITALFAAVTLAGPQGDASLKSALESLGHEHGAAWARKARAAAKVLDRDVIAKAFGNGDARVPVIVTLRSTAEVQAAAKGLGGGDRARLKARQQGIRRLQKAILSALAPGDLVVRHRFENQAGFSGSVTREGLDKLLADPRVSSVEPVRRETLFTRQGIGLMGGLAQRAEYAGQGVAIAIVDTGVDYRHPNLGGGPILDANGVPVGNGKVLGGYDFGDNDPDPRPEDHACSLDEEDLSICVFPRERHAHGTACAGIAAGEPNADGSVPGDYIGGVAPAAKLYALKVVDANCASYSDSVVAAWDWCVTHQYDDPNHPIVAISNSMGSDSRIGVCDKTTHFEGFERGNFEDFDWHRPSPQWKISVTSYRGKHSATAGYTFSGDASFLITGMECDAGTIRFLTKTSLPWSSSAALAFYIDEELVAYWILSNPWRAASFGVTAGFHTFAWGLVNLGGPPVDEAWIDDIAFPVVHRGQPTADAIAAENAVGAGITVLAASGNEGLCKAIAIPACVSNVLSVGAVYDGSLGDVTAGVREAACLGTRTTTDVVDCNGNVQLEAVRDWVCHDPNTYADMVPCWSNTAACLDILAPGDRASTLDSVGPAGFTPGDFVGDFGGTSAACPYAAGAVASLQSAVMAQRGHFLSPEEVRSVLSATGDPIYDPKADLTLPRLNLEAAIAEALRMTAP